MFSLNNININTHKWMLEIAYTKFGTTNITCLYIHARGVLTVRTSPPDIHRFISGWGGLTHRGFYFTHWYTSRYINTNYCGICEFIYSNKKKTVQGFRCQGSFSVYLRVVAYMVTFNMLYIQ